MNDELLSQFHPATHASVIAFTLVVAFVLTCLVFGVYWANIENPKAALQRSFWTMAGAFAWMLLVSVIVANGVVVESPFPRLLIFFALVNGMAILLAFTKPGTWLMSLPLWTLVGFHVFRLPLELILHEWAAQGTVPVTMTWSGSNFDIITGVLALVCAPLTLKIPKIALIFNVVGFILLLNVMRVATLSSPLPFAWNVQPPLLLAFHLPYAWIASVCVGGALAGHLILFRRMIRRNH